MICKLLAEAGAAVPSGEAVFGPAQHSANIDINSVGQKQGHGSGFQKEGGFGFRKRSDPV